MKREMQVFGVVLVAAVLAGGAPAPVVGVVQNFSTPGDALRTLVRARHVKDGEAVRRAIVVSAEKSAEVEAAVAAMVASDALQKAASDAFGSEGRRLFDPDAAKKLEEKLRAVGEMTFEISGDVATARLPAGEFPGAAPMTLRKTADGWRVDGRSFLGAPGEDAGALAARVELWKKAAAIATKMAADIAAKKYPLAHDAYRDYVKQMADAAGATPGTSPAATTTVPATTVPATRPS